MKPLTVKSKLFGLLFSLSIVNSALADDLEVYGTNTGADNKPNVMFIIDKSGSMNDGVDGTDTGPGEDSKMDILKNVFNEVLDNSAGKINAGFMFFSKKTSGVKWPIIDLDTDATTLDSDITAGHTSKDVLQSLMKYTTAKDVTNYVSPLVEVRQYFKGEKVWFNGDTGANTVKPQYWLGNHFRPTGSTSPNPSTYLPHDAYKPGNTGPNPQIKSCWDGSISEGSTNSNNCEGRELVPDSCVYYPGGEYQATRCTVDQVCVAWNADGECSNSQCPAGKTETYTAFSVPYQWCDYYNGSWEEPTYISPIASSCQANYVILLSDGLPTFNQKKWKAEEVLGDTCTSLGSTYYDGNDGDCAAELVENLATTDMIPSLPGSVVKTYTIGFGLSGDEAVKGKKFLSYLAEKGQGEFFAADSYDSLIDSFNAVIDSISSVGDDFTGISVGVKNSSFSNDNRAFINTFKPGSNRSWTGNLKGYFLGSNGLIDINGDPILDADGAIVSTAQSFWSSNPDGATVKNGGLNETIAQGDRNLYTYTGSTAPSVEDLTTDDNELVNSNATLTNAMLGVTSQTDREELLDWVVTAPISDPLHSKPVLAKYSTGEVVFTMSNQGFIHAIDAATPINTNDDSGGAELYAFIPQELLPNLGQIKTNLNTGSHIYGLDGQITFHHEDSNNDGVINTNEVARLYIGMRRGGNSYYALDISNKTRPRLLWQIKGGVGEYAAMGQSWSRMALTTLKSGTDKDVLIFGGGYDAAEDSKVARSASSIGNRVYVTDAATGNLLWSAGAGASGVNAPGMIYSVPSDLTIVDINGNGYTDHIYFGDMGGQVWRVKFEETLGNNNAPTNNFTSGATVTKIGDFGASGNRKFFYPPAVALMSQGGEGYLAVTIGSGNRANPLNQSVQDMIFMLKDPLDTPLSSTMVLSDLYDATDNLVSEGSDQAAERVLMNDADGWYMELKSGEKSISKLVVYDQKLRFTTYQPTAVISQACSESSTSQSRYYVMNLGDATPSSDGIVDESTLTAENRSVNISVQGIASEPNIVFPPEGNTVEVYVGKDNISTVHQGVKQLYWKQVH